MLVVALALAAAATAGSLPQCSRPGWTKLAALAGEWRVSFLFRTTPTHFENGTGIAIIRPGEAACTLIDQMRGRMAGKPMAFMSVLTITPDGTVERTYLDSEHGRLLHYTGTLQGSVAALAMDHPSSPKFASKAEIDMSNPSQPRVTHLLSTDGGQTWQRVLTFHYSRKDR